jgi:hypothetical protein
VVGGRAAFRVAAHPHSEAEGLTAVLERFFPSHFKGMFAMLAPAENGEGGEIPMRRTRGSFR